VKKLVIFTGAGISQESGLQTFRDEDGLWENYDIEDVATIEAWHRDPALVLDFYNQRRSAAITAMPNTGHIALAELENQFDITIITQNIDALHERAGSTDVLHLHGRIDFAKSEETGKRINIGNTDIKMGDFCEDGFQLRPDIVWFGEDVPNISIAADICKSADYFGIIGTSLNVYPAAGLIHSVNEKVYKVLVDPNLDRVTNFKRLHIINEKATIGIPMMAKFFIDKLTTKTSA
jgi:NAD-dependent deacetylase